MCTFLSAHRKRCDATPYSRNIYKDTTTAVTVYWWACSKKKKKGGRWWDVEQWLTMDFFFVLILCVCYCRWQRCLLCCVKWRDAHVLNVLGLHEPKCCVFLIHRIRCCFFFSTLLYDNIWFFFLEILRFVAVVTSTIFVFFCRLYILSFQTAKPYFLKWNFFFGFFFRTHLSFACSVDEWIRHILGLSVNLLVFGPGSWLHLFLSFLFQIQKKK